MKVAVSLPNEVFESAERLTRRLGVSRSRLYADALREYIAIHDDESLIERINAVCDQIDTALETPLRRSQTKILLREDW
jgi:metal-responsive CopG/Arc/MetJ family transcriptional regulator